MAYETWTVDGYALSAYAHDIETYDGLDDIPDRVLTDIPMAGSHGVIPGVPFFGPGRKTVAMQVSTLDAITGVQPATPDAQRANFDHNLDKLSRIFYRRNLLDVRRTLADGTTRQAFCRTVSGAKPTRVGLSAGRLVFDLQLPYSFWQDLATQYTGDILPNVGNVNATPFDAATAPMTDLNYVIVGPATNPRITEVESGSWVQYNGTVTAGNSLWLRSGPMDTTGSSFFGDMSLITHDGDVSWLTLHPTIAGALVAFTATGTTGATKLNINGMRKYLR